jgi:hypothetical protein
MNGSQPYIPGQSQNIPSPLSRFLPPLPQGMITTWLKQRFPAGTRVLDPFGSSPGMVVEAARAGYQVLVAVNNPVLRLLLELEACAPSEAEMRASLAELAASYKGDERVEPHIRGLYETICFKCGGKVEAECFLWEKGADHPYARIYHCPSCGDSGERPSTPQDREKAAEFSGSGLHQARALERIAPRGDPDRVHAEEALSMYLPRAVYALFSLINKTDLLPLSREKRQRLDALLLYACDRANSLWSHPTQRDRPRQLTVPTKFRENNLWLALEQAVRLFGESQAEKVPLSAADVGELPIPTHDQAGILLFQGRMKELEIKQQHIQCEAAFAAIPRPNQAFWTLSALWSGWLWGRESAASLKTVLRRKRYDWGWHAAALSAVFGHLRPVLKENAPLFAFSAEAEPGLVSALLSAGAWNGFINDGISIRAEASLFQVHFRASHKKGEIEIPSKPHRWAAVAAAAGRDYLRKRGQPSHYLPLAAASVEAITRQADISTGAEENKASEESPRVIDYFEQLQQAVKEGLSFREGFLRYEGSPQNPEVGMWWLVKQVQEVGDENTSTPLSDRVEIASVQSLIKNASTSLSQMDTELCRVFPGLLTPDLSLLSACLDSYAVQEPPQSGTWRLRDEDQPAARRGNLDSVRSFLLLLGKALGYILEEAAVSTDQVGRKKYSIPVAWVEPGEEAEYIFYPVASAIVRPFLDDRHPSSSIRVIVYPIERSNLINFKISKDPSLAEALQAGIRFLSYDQLTQLVDNPLTTRKTLEETLTSLPLSDRESQMRLL